MALLEMCSNLAGDRLKKSSQPHNVGSNMEQSPHSKSTLVSAFYLLLPKIYLNPYLQNPVATKTTAFITCQNEGEFPLPNAVCFAHSSICSDSDILVKVSWFQSGLALSSAPMGGLPR